MTFQPGQSGNPAGRPKGSINKQLAMLRDAAEKVIPLVVDRALAGDADAQKLILERGLPRMKPIAPPEEFELPESGALNQVRELLRQAGNGTLSVTIAGELLGVLAPLIKQEQQDLAGRPPRPLPLEMTSQGNAYLYGMQKLAVEERQKEIADWDIKYRAVQRK